jgi:hypothetical protein
MTTDEQLKFYMNESEFWRLKYLKAVEEERKACEQACLDLKYDGDWSDCAIAIRARGQK